MSAKHSVDTRPEDLVAGAETGARQATGWAGSVLPAVALAWALFQLWHASPLPYLLDFGVFNSTQARSIHLAFALFLAYIAFPARRRSPTDRIPWSDWLLGLAGAFAAAYILLFYEQLSARAGAPTTQDVIVAVVGMVLLLEATRRALGPPLMVVALVFLVYTFAGPYMPDVIAHRGASLGRAMSHQWLTTEGVFGVALGVSTSFVFLFVLFGGLLERAGAGHYFIRLAYALLGHYRGGPAKAAVVASGLSGMVSGSSIANVVTTGTFTIPLMKKVGFPATKAGAVEVAASTNGQLTPPVMGAAAFLMVEYVGISYVEVIKHALLPALISYLALFYIVHLEAVKLGMQGLTRPKATLAQRLLGIVGSFLGLTLVAAAVYYGIGWTKEVFGSAASWGLAALGAIMYLALLWVAARYPLDESESVETVPRPLPTLLSGLYFLLPVVVLVWCLTVERLSPGLSAFWASAFMMAIALTQRSLLALFRREHVRAGHLLQGAAELFEGLIVGARNMIGIAVATAAAGIVVGTVTLTGVGLVMTELVDLISGGNLFLMLLFTAVISLLLGMGLPTTANYIVVSTLMAPVIISLGAAHGLIVPLIAVHLFVFYFGILADDTPPVGLAAFAASAISGADPIRTGIQGFIYDIRTAVLPFMFIFNTKLLLIGLAGWWDLALVVVSATVAILVFAAATQGYWLTRTRWWETVLLLLIAFTLFRPGFWWDRIFPPDETLPAAQIEQVVEAASPGEALRLRVEGETLEGDYARRTASLTMGPEAPAEQRLLDLGLMLRREDDRVIADMVTFGSPAHDAGIDLDWEITGVVRATERPPKEWMFLPALLLLGLVAGSQLRRRRPESVAA